jgi:hypothetical protein
VVVVVVVGQRERRADRHRRPRRSRSSVGRPPLTLLPPHPSGPAQVLEPDAHNHAVEHPLRQPLPQGQVTTRGAVRRRGRAHRDGSALAASAAEPGAPRSLLSCRRRYARRCTELGGHDTCARGCVVQCRDLVHSREERARPRPHARGIGSLASFLVLSLKTRARARGGASRPAPLRASFQDVRGGSLGTQYETGGPTASRLTVCCGEGLLLSVR